VTQHLANDSGRRQFFAACFLLEGGSLIEDGHLSRVAALDWLAYGTGEAPTGPVSLEKNESGALALRGPNAHCAVARKPVLTGLQSATLEKLEAQVVAGGFGEMDCLEFLTTLKPKLSAIEAADRAVVL
jgi:hypothetical protein